MAAMSLPLVVAALLTACEPARSVATPEASAELAFTICPPSGVLPEVAINDRAVAILDARLVSLGVETSSIGMGAACIDVTATTASAGQDAAVRAAVLGTGTIALVSPPLDGQTTSVGAAAPAGTTPILSGSDFGAAEVAGEPPTGPALTIRFSDKGSAAIAGWSRLHAGEQTALIVDGVVVALPRFAEPVVQGVLTVPLGETPPVPPKAIAAMISSGPLPPEWAQPELPQG